MSTTDPAGSVDNRRGGVVLAVLAAAMFVYVIDTTLMNVEISALVEDLDTAVGAVPGAVIPSTSTMATFMLTGGNSATSGARSERFASGC